LVFDAKALDGLMSVITKDEVRETYDHIFIAMVNHDDSMKVLDRYAAYIDTSMNMGMSLAA